MKEIKRTNKIRIAKFILEKGVTSKNEIAAVLGISMPTTLQNVRELVEDGYVVESGQYESTGGRKASALSVAADIGYAVGMDITAHHISFVLVDMKRELVRRECAGIRFENTYSYYNEQAQDLLGQFIDKTGVDRGRIIGIGISLPGIVDRENKILIRSHALGVENVSFKGFGGQTGFPYSLENDANSAAHAEFMKETGNAVYLSLSDTVGGAVCFGGSLYPGENFKSGEFGHMIIEKGGRRCYCGKSGCVDAYCCAKNLKKLTDGDLEMFFERVKEGDAACTRAWEEYVEYLAVTVTNLRMIFDCDIILGGYVGGYLEEFLPVLKRKVMEYNNFDADVSYLRTGKFRSDASAYGVTLDFIERFFDRI